MENTNELIWQELNDKEKQEIITTYNTIKQKIRKLANQKTNYEKKQLYTEEQQIEYRNSVEILQKQYNDIKVYYKCNYCDKTFQLTLDKLKLLIKDSNKLLFCSVSCSGKYYAIKSHNKTEEEKQVINEKIRNTLREYNSNLTVEEKQKKYSKVDNPITTMVIIHKCTNCKKEFELSYNQKKKYLKDNNAKVFCSFRCRNIYNATKERPIVQCAYCGKNFTPSNDQFTKYNKNPNAPLYCSRSCIAKEISKHTDYTDRSNKMKQLYKDKDWVAKRTAKTKATNLKKYGVENVFQLQEVKEKSKQTKLKKYGSENYHNTAKMLETMAKNGFDIYAPRPDVGKKVSQAWKNKTEEEKQKIKEKLSISNTKAHKETTLQRKLEISTKLSVAQKQRWENITDEEKAKIFKKVFNHPNNVKTVISKLNRDIAKELNINTFEFSLGKYSYDLYKEPNILIEINPIYTHNCLQGTWYGSEPKTKEYHRDKTQYAVDNNYKCINIFDWDDIEKIKYLLQDKQTIYARQLTLKSVSEEECNNFLNSYHFQNSCKGQILRFGLYYKDILVEIMTFGKPRYNKNYEWELLRLCTKPNYKVVGGAEKLFKHFVDAITPTNIISYCDYSKFTGEVYTKLNFKQRGIAIPSKHWIKGSQHITDNLLRQRGFDQLFNTNYGKGTSNEELMIEHGWLPIYDCGQITFVWQSK